MKNDLTANEIIFQTNKRWESGQIAIGDYIRILTDLESARNLKRNAEELQDKAYKIKEQLIEDYMF